MKRSARAYAKINLTLDITGKRQDGYHTLDSVMQSVSLWDTLHFSVIPEPSTARVICRLPGLSEKENLVYAAVEAYRATTGLRSGVCVELEKGIPTAAGMGGGSADAAAALLLCESVFGALPKKTEQQLALSLGADVPFCLTGGCMRAGGIGEQLEPVENHLSDLYYVWVKDGEKLSTAEMYRRLDQMGAQATAFTSAMVRALSAGDREGFCRSLSNAFCRVSAPPALSFLQKNSGNGTVNLSGSGPCCYAAFFEKTEAEKALQLCQRVFSNCSLVRAVPFGVEILPPE